MYPLYMSTSVNNGTVSGAILQLALLPLTLAWAICKGVLLGVLAVITLGVIS